MKEFGEKIKVLIADDSFFMRKLLRRLIEEAGDFEVVGEAKDGKEVVKLAEHLAPDVITMDYHMPFLTGAQATQAIIDKVNPAPSIIMLSAYTREGAEETLESLRAGAIDFICKPSGELSLDIDKIAEEIFDKIRIAATAKVRPLPSVALKERKGIRFSDKVKRGSQDPHWLVVIGASTGGPPVLEEILTRVNDTIPASFLIVQHMPAHFTKSFAQRLDKMTNLIVSEAVADDLVIEGGVLIAPGDYHMTLARQNSKFVVKLNQDSEINGLRPSIDVLFESVAKVWKGNIIGIELTGMGDDGSRTMKLLKNIGATIIAQDPETAVVDSMPENIINQGIVDEVLSPIKIASKINEIILKNKT